MSTHDFNADGESSYPDPSDGTAQNDAQLAILRRNGLYTTYLKPILDRLGGVLLLLLLSPVIVTAIILVWVKVGRPLIFKQQRIGQGGQTFELYKIRTMIPDRRQQDTPIVGPDRRAVHKSPEDPRVLPIGKTLRSWRLDELPQFWNVVKGDMSLVGPRPELPEIVANYVDWQHQRHLVKPGVTGPWQISDRNGKLMHECTDLDLEYIAHVKFSRDISILAHTPFAMIGQRRGF